MDIIQKDKVSTLTSSQKTRYSSVSESFIKGTSPFMLNYVEQIQNLSAIKGLKQKYFKHIKQKNDQIEEKQDELQKQIKKHNNVLSDLLFGTSLLLGGYLIFKRQINQFYNKVYPKVVQVFQMFKSVGGKISSTMFDFLEKYKINEHIGNLLVDIWYNISYTISDTFDLVGKGFDFLLNQKNPVYGKNIFFVIFNNVLSETFRKLNKQITLQHVLKIFGIKVSKGLPSYSNLQKYIKQGGAVLRQVGVSVQGSQSVLRGEGAYAVTPDYSSRGFNPINAFQRNREVPKSGANLWIRQIKGPIGGDSVLDIPIDTYRWDNQGLGNAINTFFNDIFQKHAANYINRVSTSSIHSQIESPFGKEWNDVVAEWNVLKMRKVGQRPSTVKMVEEVETVTTFMGDAELAVAGFIAELPDGGYSWIKNMKAIAALPLVLDAVRTKKVVKEVKQYADDGMFGSKDEDIILKNMMYSSTDRTLYDNFVFLYQRLKPFGVFLPWWGELEKQFDYLTVAFNGKVVEKVGYPQRFIYSTKQGQFFSVGDMGKMIYLSCVMPVIFYRLERDTKVTRELTQHDKWLQQDGITGVLKTSLYHKLEYLRQMNIGSNVSQLSKLIYSIENGSVRPSQYLKFVKEFLQRMLKNQKDSPLFQGLNSDKVHRNTIDVGMMISLIQSIINLGKDIKSHYRRQYFPSNIPLKVRRFVHGDKTIVAYQNVLYYQKRYSNTFDYNVVANKLGTHQDKNNKTMNIEDYVSSVQLCIEIVNQFRIREKQKKKLHVIRQKKMKQFHEGLRQLAKE